MAKLVLEKKTSGPKAYGENLFIIKTVKSVCDQQEIAVRAAGWSNDEGDLIFFDENEQPTLSIARGGWNAVYLADETKQIPVSVERWHNEVGRTIVVQKEYTDEEMSKIILGYIDENDNIKNKIYEKLLEALEEETSTHIDDENTETEETEVAEEVTAEEIAGMSETTE